MPPDVRVVKAVASDGYLEAMGIRLVRGRTFAASDGPDAQRVVVVSEPAARLLWPGEDAIGREISLQTPARSDTDWLTVIGVVADVRQQGLTQDLSSTVYKPYLQVEREFFLRRMTFVAHGAADAMSVAPAFRTALRTADPTLPVPTLRTMQSFVETWTNAPVFQARALGAAAFTALMLTIVGLYSVLAYAVSGRTRELAIRLALGASASGVIWMVVRRTALWTVAGLSVGTAGAFALSRWMESLLFEVTPTDPVTFAGALATLTLAALAAAALPAWHASRVSPSVTLSAE